MSTLKFIAFWTIGFAVVIAALTYQFSPRDAEPATAVDAPPARAQSPAPEYLPAVADYRSHFMARRVAQAHSKLASKAAACHQPDGTSFRADSWAQAFQAGQDYIANGGMNVAYMTCLYNAANTLAAWEYAIADGDNRTAEDHEPQAIWFYADQVLFGSPFCGLYVFGTFDAEDDEPGHILYPEPCLD